MLLQLLLASNNYDELARRRENPFRLTKWQAARKVTAFVLTPIWVIYCVNTSFTDEFF